MTHPARASRVPVAGRRGFLLGAVVTLGLAGCGGSDSGGSGGSDGSDANGSDTASKDQGGAGSTRTVRDYKGQVDVPVKPRRILTLDTGASLQVALEVGAPLVAGAVLQGKTPIPSYLPEPPKDFQQLKWFTDINLERVQELQPDLIIGSPPAVEQTYDKLKRIAPTAVYANSSVGTRWRESCRSVASFLGATDREEAKISAYEKRAKEFASRHRKLVQSVKVGLLRFTSDELRIITQSVIFASSPLKDCGFVRPANQVPDDPQTTYLTLSKEQIGSLDNCDVLLYFTGGGGFANKESGGVFSSYTSSALWKRLPAVKAGKAFEVPQIHWWDGYSPSAANACIDDLDKIVTKL